MIGCSTRPKSLQNKGTRKTTEEFWGSGISKYPIDPDTEERIKGMYLNKFRLWNSPDYPCEKPKGVNIAYLRVVPLGGENFHSRNLFLSDKVLYFLLSFI